jgi:uncharacterized membrane protein YozB (DUF420 family)
MAMEPIITRGGKDRRLYALLALLFPLVVLIGFARTYYLKGFFDTPALPGRLVHLHGIVMTTWVVLFIVQIWLVASRRTKLHQRLGIWGAVLASLVFVIGIATGIDAAARAAAPPGIPPLRFLVVPLADMLLFAILIGTALYFRRRMDIHKRLMLLAAVNLFTPAIARIQLQFIQTGGPLAFFGLTDLFLLGFVTFDTVRNRRLNPAFLWGSLLIILSQPLRLALAGTDIWLRFAALLVSVWN